MAEVDPAANSAWLTSLSKTALPLIDQEYDIPEYKTYVDHLIAEEMRASGDENAVKLSDRFETLWSNAELESCLKRIEERGLATEPKLQKNRAELAQQAPSGKDKDNLEAWKHSLDRVKTQLMYQENELTGLDLLVQAYSDDESPFHSLWHTKEKRFLSSLSAVHEYYAHEDQCVAREVQDLQKTRQTLQSKAHPALYKYWQRKQQAYISRAQVDVAFQQLNSHLKARGFDFDAEEKRLEEEIQNNLLRSHTVNNTVREYEAVTEHEAMEDTNQDEHKTSKKRSSVEEIAEDSLAAGKNQNKRHRVA